jgi:transcriptional regulator with XRE-family HTH domain
VKWARSRQFRSAIAAAAALGIKDGTYRCYERGPESAKFIRLDYKHAKKFAQLFKVRWEWLLDGVGEPWLTPEDADDAETVPPAQRENLLRTWREYRGLTQEELAKRAKLPTQTIADLESQPTPLSTKWLNRLAPCLDTRAGYLLSHDPETVAPETIETFGAIPKDRRGQVLEILKTFKPYNRLR